MVQKRDYDSIIIGGGTAGLRASIELAKTCKVAVVSKLHPLRSNSVAAQGGINAALRSPDSWQKHMEDTVKAGAYLSDQDAVEFLTKNARKAVIELEHFGVLFSRDEKKKIAQRRMGAQSEERSCYAADKTGQTLLNTLFEQALKRGVEFYDEMFATKIVLEDNVCKGAVCLDIRTGETYVFNTKSVLLATGGYARIFGTSSNSYANTGDSQAMLFREGIALQDMEFIQFHPTGLYPSGILIGEAARGHGGILINNRSERFMQRYDDRMELATRDILSKAMQKEIRSGRGINQNDYLYLDLTKIDKDILDKKLPQVVRLAKDFAGVDAHSQPIPVRPTAHYSMGGIPTDNKTRVLTRDDQPVKGLYAAGECACLSIHGANRLGGNSLLETVVFGKQAGKEMLTYNLSVNRRQVGDESIKEVLVELERIRKSSGNERASEIRTELNELMDKKAGIFRDQRGLYEARDKIRDLKQRLTRVNIMDKGKIFNTEIIEYLELKNMLEVAQAIVYSALARKESRGAHTRTDFPNKKKEYLVHSLVYSQRGNVSVKFKNVVMKNIKPET